MTFKNQSIFFGDGEINISIGKLVLLMESAGVANLRHWFGPELLPTQKAIAGSNDKAFYRPAESGRWFFTFTI